MGWLPYVKFPEYHNKLQQARKSARLIRELKEYSGEQLQLGRFPT